jgi:uncharacterized protein YfaS (alpha-2-macroglobulin family)
VQEAGEGRNDFVESVLVAMPSKDVPIGDDWKLVCAFVKTKGTQSARATSRQSIYLGNIPVFSVAGVQHHQGYDRRGSISVSFNKALPDEFGNDEIDKWVSISPSVSDWKVKRHHNGFVINADFETGLYYSISISKELAAADGMTLGHSYDKSVKFEPMPPHLSVPAYRATQYASGKKSFEIISANHQTVRVKVKKIAAKDAVRALEAYSIYETNPERPEDGEALQNIPWVLIPGRAVYEQVFESAVQMDHSDKFEVNWSNVLSPLDGETPTGLLFVSVEGEPKKGLSSEYGKGTVAQSLVQLTDIGLAWKRQADEALLYAFSQHTGQALSGVSLARFAAEERPVGEAIFTDPSGMAHVPLESAKWLVATLGDDIQAIQFGESLPELPMWQFPVDMEWRSLEKTYRETNMFTDRPLYKPGETVHLKCHTRMVQGTQLTVPENRDARLKVFDARERVILNRDVTFTERGSFSESIELPGAEAGQGIYRVKVAFADPGIAKEFVHYIYVQDYKANTFAANIDVDKVIQDGEMHRFPLAANYLMGKPLSKAKVNWSASVRDTSFYTEEWQGYRFGDFRSHQFYDSGRYHRYYPAANRVRAHYSSGDTQLKDDGTADIDVLVAKQAEFPTRRIVSVTASVTDINQQTITARGQTIIESSDFYLLSWSSSNG